MAFWDTYGTQVVTIAAAAISGPLISKVLPKAKPKLTSGIAHTFVYLVPTVNPQEGQAPTFPVTTARFRIRNEGRQVATNVVAMFNWKPRAINLAPLRPFHGETQDDNRYVVQLGNLQPREEVNIEILVEQVEVPMLVRVHATECVAKEVQLWTVQAANPKLVGLQAGLRVLGISTLLLWAWQLGQFAWSHWFSG